jgi:protein-tyrosine phosphatase
VNKYLLTDLLNSYNADVTPSTFSNGEARLDAQVPVTLRVSVKEGSAISYKIELATNDSFFNAKVSYIEASSGTYSFEHLYANRTYYYRVTVYTSKGADSLTGHFKTADTPRILSIDGLSNVRDIGNWRTDSGKRIKQGLLIRGTELDGAVERDYHLTNEGLIDMLDVFGIKTDLDLRAQSARTQNALGSRVEHRYYDMVMYGDIFTDDGKDKVRMVFSDLANPDNYPIYLHCTYGCDRTGTICYLLEALLGVSRGDCLKEYGLSNRDIANIQAVETGLKSYEGDTLKEQVESYPLSCGVSEYQISSIRNIFLGD